MKKEKLAHPTHKPQANENSSHETFSTDPTNNSCTSQGIEYKVSSEKEKEREVENEGEEKKGGKWQGKWMLKKDERVGATITSEITAHADRIYTQEYRE